MIAVLLLTLAQVHAAPAAKNDCRFVRLDGHANSLEFVGGQTSAKAQLAQAWRLAHDSRNPAKVGATPPPVLTRVSATALREVLLRPHAQPLSLTYCANVLKKGRYYRGLAAQGKRCYRHDDRVALVIGMRRGFSAESCQYLVRGSGPAKCDGYSRDWECDRGNVWVDARALLANTKSLAVLESAKSP